MANKIVNRVANSKLKTIDLEDFYPQGKRTIIDIKKWLFQELILRETEFREHLKNYDWTKYNNHFVALTCSTDAIIPSWAYMLITTYLSPYAKNIVIGDLSVLETSIFQQIVQNINLEEYRGRPVIIKGCANKPIPETAYLQLITKLQPIVKSIMFGEACSTVPLFKRN
ncbi:DUF2480 family protein [uncultured Lutibacter sp.]|uniref:DUF2480 family protein n=1 Tax=Lutibacter sp. TaxID=1925666 RepID=UPI00262A22B8|nr:DUF2480 family protein [uncultured Lutibacter sp.]